MTDHDETIKRIRDVYQSGIADLDAECDRSVNQVKFEYECKKRPIQERFNQDIAKLESEDVTDYE